VSDVKGGPPRRARASTSPTFGPDALREIYAHMEWADARVWSVVLTNEQLADDVVIRDKLAHIHVVQWAYLKPWTQQPWKPPLTRDLPDLRTIWAWAHPYYAEVKAFLGAANIDGLARPLPESLAGQIEADLGARAVCPSVADSAFQVACHATHHRGQLNTRLRERGAAPLPVDYIAWVWFGRPGPEWTIPPDTGRPDPPG
jgi:uncharacterized damage-inducible protein DinB